MYQKETPLLNLLDSYMFYSFSSTSSVLLCCAVAEGWSGVEWEGGMGKLEASASCSVAAKKPEEPVYPSNG